MLPDNVLSSQVLSTSFRYPRNIPRTATVDYVHGGVNFNDPSQGLEVRTWRGTLNQATGGITLETVGVDPVVWYTAVNATTFSFTFDQNMNPFIAYDTETSALFYWFDTTINGYRLTELPGAKNARCDLDDRRTMQSAKSDIILAYLRDDNLYFRAQRDRYEVEYLLETGLTDMELRQVGMNNNWRFQFQLVPIV